MTDEQRAAASGRATQVRRERAALLAMVKAGDMTAGEYLTRCDTAARNTRVRRFVRSWPGVGDVTAARVMDECGISATRRVGGLGRRQREALLAAYERICG